MNEFELINQSSNQYFDQNNNIILLTFDENWYMQAINTMLSVKYYNPNTSFICICTELSNNVQQILLNNNFHLGILLYQYQINFTLNNPKWHDIVCFRLFAPWLITIDVVNILYLDCDILCKGDLLFLFEATCPYYIMTTDLAGNSQSHLDHTGLHLYCNSGVIKMNLSAIKSYYTFDKMFNSFMNNVSQLVYPDQDFLNFYIEQDKIYKINGIIYNFQPGELIGSVIFDQSLRNAKLIHFASLHPWENNCIIPAMYDLYLQHSFYPPSIQIVCNMRQQYYNKLRSKI